MNVSATETSFRSAVSDVKQAWVGQGPSRRKHERRIYYLAERFAGEQDVALRLLGPTWVPLEEWLQTMSPEEFAQMRPEPLIYFNKVLPAMQTLESSLDKGDRLRESGRHERAVECYREAIRLSPTNVRASFGLGISYLQMGKIDNALLFLDQILELNSAFLPNYKHLFNEFGIALRKAGLHEQALNYYLKATKHGGEDEHLLFNIARILCEVGDYERMISVLDRALEMNPQFAAALSLLRYAKGELIK